MSEATPIEEQSMVEAAPSARLREVAAVFLRLGATAFGGPAA